MQRERSNHLPKLVVFLVFAGLTLIALAVFGWFRYESAQMRNGLDDLELPDSWQFTQEEKFGNWLCLDSCPGLSRNYIVSEDTKLNKRMLNEIIKSSEFRLTKKSNQCVSPSGVSGDYPICSVIGKKGDLKLSITVFEASNIHRGTDSSRGKKIVTSLRNTSYILGLLRDE